MATPGAPHQKGVERPPPAPEGCGEASTLGPEMHQGQAAHDTGFDQASDGTVADMRD